VGKKRRIIKYPDKRLKIKSFKDGNNKSVIEALKASLKDGMGIGLSAIQIGQPVRVFIVFDLIAINPEIVSFSKEAESSTEGCLSFPRNFTRVIVRSKEIDLKYYDEDGECKTEHFDGLESFAIQHEMDHLNGIVIIDY